LGDDALLGGTDFDTYIYNTGDGFDTILDTGGDGSIVVDGVILGGRSHPCGRGAVWRSSRPSG